MLSGLREKLEDLALRAGLTGASGSAVLVVALVAAVVAGVALVRGAGGDAGPEVFTATQRATGASAAASTVAESSEPSRAPDLVVHVVGAVRHTGVYRLPRGSRAQDAVAAAGGLLGDAAPGALNLARVLQDGEQLVVPTRDEAARGEPAAAGAAGGAAAPGGTAPADRKVDLNTATAEQLDALPGIGPATAAKIVREREANGPFRSVEDLSRVAGIGPKKVEGLKDLVTVR